MSVRPGKPVKQQGAAHLVMALAISMSITLVTLAVARTQLDEQKLSANSRWHTRLALAAQSAWHQRTATLVRDFETLDWDESGTGLVLDIDEPDETLQPGTVVRLSRRTPDDRLIDIQATAYRNDSGGQQASYSQTVRLISALTPAAESPPPLMLNGCLLPTLRPPDIRPRFSDTEQAEDAVWIFESKPCGATATPDTHEGAIRNRPLIEPLWSVIFSIDREEFSAMSTAEQSQPQEQRRYLTATPDQLSDGQWVFSLGTIDRPVIVYFPAETGCPQFADGVTIVGVVFIDSDCRGTIADGLLQISGTLAVNGDLNTGTADVRLNHTQVIDENKYFLDFSPLYSVRVPGSWRDF